MAEPQVNNRNGRPAALDPQSVSVPTRLGPPLVTDDSPQQEQQQRFSPTNVTLHTSLLASNNNDNFRVILRLDHDEERLFDILVSTADAFERGDLTLPHVPCQHVEIRVAGGWVRDKILGMYSHDVDIAVDCLTGKDFATLVQAHVLGLKNNNNSKEEDKLVGKMGVISANPSQSKHLETATMMVHHVDVDFTNLRGSEIYAHDTRIPTTTFGTALDDATRRDFTVNALFYNLRSCQVEDWTRRGIVDLHRGVLVTPLDPMTTFHDDPLRVLRAIRFAVRYNFRLNQDLEQACMSREVHKSLHVKVSRERVGKELEAMLTGKGAQPSKALETITRLKLAGSVFCIPTLQPVVGTIMGHPYVGSHDELSHLREVAWEESCALLKLMPCVVDAYQKTIAAATTNNNTTALDSRLLHVATFLLPFRHLTFTNHKDKVQGVVSYMVRDGIKFKSRDVVQMTTLMETVNQMTSFLSKQKNNAAAILPQNNTFRMEAGMLLRTTKELWVTGLLLSTISVLRQVERDDAATHADYTTILSDSVKEGWLQLSCHVYKTIVNEMGLDHCWTMKPLMNGKAVIEALDLPRGPQVGVYLEEQMKWMLLNPSGKKQDVEVHLMHYKRKLETKNSLLEYQEEEEAMGISDGVGPSSPMHTSRKQPGNDDNKHFSKKMHVESMDLL